MKLKKFRTLTIVMLVLALLLGVSAPVVNAEGPYKDTSATDTKVSAQDAATALKFRQEADLEMKKSERPPIMQTSDVGYVSSAAAWDNVVLGTDKTFYTADGGNNDAGHSGLVSGWWDSHYYLSTRKAEAVTVIGPAGWGSAWAWASVGKFFQTSGGGSRSANIRINGNYSGMLAVVGAANCAFTISLRLYDYTTSSYNYTIIAQDSRGVAGVQNYDGSFNQNLNVLLQSGCSPPVK